MLRGPRRTAEKEKDHAMLVTGASIGFLILALLAGAVAWGCVSCRRDLRGARRRLAGISRLIETASGPIEYAEAGDGPAVLISHGAGGGFDQGLELGQPLAESGFKIVAPSRFGYLRSPPAAHPSAAGQADAYAQLLDALAIRRVAILGVSAGGPAAIEFAIRYPHRCAALILLVPLTYMPPDRSSPARRLSPWAEKILMTIVSSDLAFWLASKFARKLVLSTVLGTPPKLLAAADTDEQTRVLRVMQMIQPVSARIRGIVSDSHISAALAPFALDRISVPTLVMSARDDGYRTFAAAEYTAKNITNARFIGFDSGGHMLVGHREAMIGEVLRLLHSLSDQDSASVQARQQCGRQESRHESRQESRQDFVVVTLESSSTP
jgi:pimeloyl-ACP methyl ester carboxylesterase